MRLAAVGDNCIDAYTKPGLYMPGGNAVNVAVNIRRLGSDASYVGMIGDDANGTILLDGLKREGVDTSHVHILPGKTAVTYVELDGNERILGDYEEGVGQDFDLTNEDIEFISAHDAVHSGIWGHAEPFLGSIKASGKPIFFDFADKLESDLVPHVLPLVDYAFFSYPQEDVFIKEYLKKAVAQGSRVAIATLGEHGSMAYDGQRFISCGIVPVEVVVDTMGAGDSYIAGFLQAIVDGHSVEDAMGAGAQNASKNITFASAW